MARVYLGLGSNIDREASLASGLDALAVSWRELALSPVYDSQAVGFTGEPFLNMVVGLDTGLGPGELAAHLRAIEIAHGRAPDATRYSPRQLDIDILLYDDLVGSREGVELPRPEVLYNAFVLRPLAELAPQRRHPVVAKSYAELWRDYDQASQPLRRVAFYWQGRLISRPE